MATTTSDPERAQRHSVRSVLAGACDIVALIGVAAVLIGTLAGFVFALRAAKSPAILPNGTIAGADTKEGNDGDTGSTPAISDDGPAADSYRDARTV